MKKQSNSPGLSDVQENVTSQIFTLLTTIFEIRVFKIGNSQYANGKQNLRVC